MSNVLTRDNYLSTVNHTIAPQRDVAAWQHRDVTLPSFRENLKSYMGSNGVNGNELAARIRVTAGAVSRWLKIGRVPSGQDLLAIARVLKVDPFTLVGSSFREPDPPRADVSPPGRRPKVKPSEDAVEVALRPLPRRPKPPPALISVRAIRPAKRERE